jgi:AcrR family transcriptional regulator
MKRQWIVDASVDDVVRRSGLSKGTLYWYFKSKDRLVGALMKRFFAQELEKARLLQQGPGAVSIFPSYLAHDSKGKSDG